jgi:hypothetical protein
MSISPLQKALPGNDWLSNLFQTSPKADATPIYPTQTPFDSSMAGAPSPGQLTNVPTMTGGQINPQAAAMQAAQQNPTSPDSSQSPTLAALLGGLKAVGGQQGGQSGPAPANGGNGGMQGNTAALAAYKPMNFAGKAMIPPQIMQALMMMSHR